MNLNFRLRMQSKRSQSELRTFCTLLRIGVCVAGPVSTVVRHVCREATRASPAASEVRTPRHEDVFFSSSSAAKSIHKFPAVYKAAARQSLAVAFRRCFIDINSRLRAKTITAARTDRCDIIISVFNIYLTSAPVAEKTPR